MTYLTKEEFQALGFPTVEQFDRLLPLAKMSIDGYIGHFYSQTDFETDFEPRKAAVKLAVAFQVAYLDSSGVMTAEDKQQLASLSLGRTSISYQGGHRRSSDGLSKARQYNLSLDAETALNGAGFSYAGVSYDR